MFEVFTFNYQLNLKQILKDKSLVRITTQNDYKPLPK